MTDPHTQGQQTAPKTALFTKVLVLFLIAMILANIGGKMIEPLMAIYLKDLDASVAQVGLFFTLAQIIPLLLQILGGWISDSVGRLRAIAFGSVFGLINYVFMIVAPSWEWLLIASAFSSVAGALVGPSFSAFIAENSSEENRAKTYGISQALFAIVGVVGPALGGLLSGKFGFKIMLLAGAALYASATIIRIFLARGAREEEQSGAKKLSFTGLKANLGGMFSIILSGGIVAWIMITDGVSDTAFSLSVNLFPLFMNEIAGLNLEQVGVIWSTFSMFMLLTMLLGGWMADKAGERLTIALGFFMMGVSLFFFVHMESFWGFFVVRAVAGAGSGFLSPAYQSLISKAVPEKLRGTAFGLFSTSIGLLSLPAPALGAQLWDIFNPAAPIQITAFACLAATAIVMLKFRLPEKEVEDITAQASGV